VIQEKGEPAKGLLDNQSETDERELAFYAAFSKLLLAQANTKKIRTSANNSDAHMNRALHREYFLLASARIDLDHLDQ
jgi:hypothetical protein